MRNYPKPGDTVRHKGTGEKFIVKGPWRPGSAETTDGSIFRLRGIEPVKRETRRTMTVRQAVRKARRESRKTGEAYVVYSREWEDLGFAVCSLGEYYADVGILEKDVVEHVDENNGRVTA